MGVITTISVIAIIVFGFAFFMYNKSKPKKVGYAAKVYKKVGSPGSTELDLFMKDFLIMRKPAPNVKKWELEKLGLLLTKEPSAEDIKSEGKQKYVDILFEKGKLSLLKRPRYDDKEDKQIFESYDYDKNAFCEIRRELENKRLQNNKNPLEIISKWVVVALTMFGLIGITYIQSDGYIQQSENMIEASENFLLASEIISNSTKQLGTAVGVVNGNIGNQINTPISTNTNTNEVKTFG